MKHLARLMSIVKKRGTAGKHTELSPNSEVRSAEARPLQSCRPGASATLRRRPPPRIHLLASLLRSPSPSVRPSGAAG
eukprot:525644-Alexandrium_andersonii.AAC.1